jgi:hypothetical protein
MIAPQKIRMAHNIQRVSDQFSMQSRSTVCPSAGMSRVLVFHGSGKRVMTIMRLVLKESVNVKRESPPMLCRYVVEHMGEL